MNVLNRILILRDISLVGLENTGIIYLAIFTLVTLISMIEYSDISVILNMSQML